MLGVLGDDGVATEPLDPSRVEGDSGRVYVKDGENYRYEESVVNSAS